MNGETNLWRKVPNTATHRHPTNPAFLHYIIIPWAHSSIFPLPSSTIARWDEKRILCWQTNEHIKLKCYVWLGGTRQAFLVLFFYLFFYFLFFLNTTKKHPFPHEMIKRDYALIIKWGTFLAEHKNVARCSYGKVILRYITGLYRSP
jgi:hypothetical protein